MRDIVISHEKRPCYVLNKILHIEVKALFHCWSVENNTTRGIVEFEDGSISVVPVSDIVFADGILDQYCFIPMDELHEIAKNITGENK